MKKISTTVYLRPEQDDALERIAAAFGTTVKELIREGVDEVIAKRQPPEAK